MSDQIFFGRYAETCLVQGCGYPLSSDGCTNPKCFKSRPTYPIQEALRIALLTKRMVINPPIGGDQCR